jgi:Uma2 family endonuclease
VAIDAGLTTHAKILLAMTAEHTYVPNVSPPGIMTADDLLEVRIPDKHVELVRGVLMVRELPGFTHGRVTANLTYRLAAHIENTGASLVLLAETGFKLAEDPDTVRGPDLAVVRREQLPVPEPPGFMALGPELVVEVLLPGDRPGQVLAKVADWLSAGTKLVWVIDPERRVARVYRHDGTEQTVTAAEVLDGEDVVPGFSCLLNAVL